MKNILLFSIALCLAQMSYGSATYLTLNKSGDHGVNFKIDISPSDAGNEDYFSVTVSFPNGQETLSDLYGVHLSSRSPYLLIPLQINQIDLAPLMDERRVHFSIEKRLLYKAHLMIRCGKHAPLSEDIYLLHLVNHFPE